MRTNLVLKVLVRSRNEVLFEGKARSVSSKNETGNFDVLPSHGNFISLVNAPVRLVTDTGLNEVIPVTNGLIRVSNNLVEIFVGIGQGKMS